jgi:hypothetical protein
MIREGPALWRIVNHEYYRDLRSDEDRKAYERDRKARYRARQKAEEAAKAATVPDASGQKGTPVSVSGSSDSLNQKGTGKKKRKRPERFVKPTVDQVNALIEERGYTFKGQDFIDYFESVGWVVGKTQKPMKSWSHAMATFQKNQGEPPRPRPKKRKPAEKRLEEARKTWRLIAAEIERRYQGRGLEDEYRAFFGDLEAIGFEGEVLELIGPAIAVEYITDNLLERLAVVAKESCSVAGVRLFKREVSDGDL